MSTTATPDQFTALPDEQALASTVTALEEHGSASRSWTISTRPVRPSSPASRTGRR